MCARVCVAPHAHVCGPWVLYSRALRIYVCVRLYTADGARRHHHARQSCRRRQRRRRRILSNQLKRINFKSAIKHPPCAATHPRLRQHTRQCGCRRMYVRTRAACVRHQIISTFLTLEQSVPIRSTLAHTHTCTYDTHVCMAITQIAQSSWQRTRKQIPLLVTARGSLHSRIVCSTMAITRSFLFNPFPP